MARPTFDDLFKDSNVRIAIQEEIDRQIQVAIEELKTNIQPTTTVQ